MAVSYHNKPVYDSCREDRLPSIGTLRAPRTGLRSGKGKTYTAAELLWARTIKQPTGCWEVQGWALPHSGHVHISGGRGKPVLRAHRLSWELAHGPIPSGLVVCHKCDNPRCVNPDHLFLGTQRDNIIDSVRKGRYNAFGKQKLNAAQVLEIRALAARGFRHKDIAARFGVKRHTVTGIVNRKSWGHI